MFELYFTNIPDRGLVSEHRTLTEAAATGRRHGFDFHVMRREYLMCSWTVFGGLVCHDIEAYHEAQKIRAAY